MSERPDPARQPDDGGGRDDRGPGPGGGIGRDAEPERPESSQLEKDSQAAGLPADQPDEGWQDWPAGHRQGRPADDDLQRRKG